jgi:hypothetical protein
MSGGLYDGLAGLRESARQHCLVLKTAQPAERLRCVQDGTRSNQDENMNQYTTRIELTKVSSRTGESSENEGSDTTFVVTNDIGRGRNYWLARLDRDGPTELAAKVRAGEMSVHAAVVQLGWRRKPRPLERLLKRDPKLSDGKRARLLALLDKISGKKSG